MLNVLRIAGIAALLSMFNMTPQIPHRLRLLIKDTEKRVFFNREDTFLLQLGNSDTFMLKDWIADSTEPNPMQKSSYFQWVLIDQSTGNTLCNCVGVKTSIRTTDNCRHIDMFQRFIDEKIYDVLQPGDSSAKDEENNSKTVYRNKIGANTLAIFLDQNEPLINSLMIREPGTGDPKCHKCENKTCTHMSGYKHIMKTEPTLRRIKVPKPIKRKTHESISKSPIDFPYSVHLKSRMTELCKQGYYYSVTDLVPKIPKYNPHCKCGNPWDTKPPSSYTSGHLYNERGKTPVKVYYRYTLGYKCECKLFYTGETECIFNFDNYKLAPYDFMMMIHMMFQTTRATFFQVIRALNAKNACVSDSPAMCDTEVQTMYKSFLKLLDFSRKEAFECSKCAKAMTSDENDEIMVFYCDGVQIGSKQDLTDVEEDRTCNVIPGDPHKGGVEPKIRRFAAETARKKLRAWMLAIKSNSSRSVIKRLRESTMEAMEIDIQSSTADPKIPFDRSPILRYLSSIPAKVPEEIREFLEDISK